MPSPASATGSVLGAGAGFDLGRHPSTAIVIIETTTSFRFITLPPCTHTERLLHLRNLHRRAILRTDDRRFQHLLRLVRVLEIRHRYDRGLAADHAHHVRDLVNEAVLITNDMCIRPPVADVR